MVRCHYALHQKVDELFRTPLCPEKPESVYSLYISDWARSIKCYVYEAHNNGENACTRSFYSLMLAHSSTLPIRTLHLSPFSFSSFISPVSPTRCHLLWKFSSSRLPFSSFSTIVSRKSHLSDHCAFQG